MGVNNMVSNEYNVGGRACQHCEMFTCNLVKLSVFRRVQEHEGEANQRDHWFPSGQRQGCS